MPTRYYVGAKTLRGDIAAYAKRFDLLEVQSGAAGPGAPSIATLKKWRKSVPPPFAFTVVAEPALASLRPGPPLEEARQRALSAADVLEARCVLLPTPSEVTPGAVWRDRLARVIEGLRREVTHLVWQPAGLWEIDDAAVLAKKLGVVLAVDAARDPVPVGPVSYCRLRALGETRSFGAAALTRVVRAIGPRREAFVILETDSALAECKLLRAIAQEPEGMAGGARVVRPRTPSVRIRDDEQE